MNLQETSFPQFSNQQIQNEPKQQIIQNPSLQKSDYQKKQQIFEKLTDKDTNKNQIDKQINQFTCFICHEYFVKPVTTKCGHSFCQFCLQQYFLFSKQCPICHKNVRGSLLTYNTVLNEFIDSFIRSNHRDYLESYQQKIQKYKIWKSSERILPNFKAGMNLDVRDQNYIWCKGIVLRVISRVGEPIKFLKIQYRGQNNMLKEEQIKWNNQRVAPAGFYTDRKQIPKYKDLIQSIDKNK